MTTINQQMTAAQLAALPEDGKRYELVRGELFMMSPAGNRHGRIAMRLAWRLAHFVEENDLGVVYAAETGFLISREPDTVLAPDVAFVLKETLEESGDLDGYLPAAPRLVAEVVSPNDTFSRVEEKALAWLDAGTMMVLVVDPDTRTVHVFRARDDIAVLTEEDELDAADVVSGWKIALRVLFE
jgi:Uma2 family endonuclease